MKTVSIDVKSASIYPRGIYSFNVDLDVEESELTGLLDEMNEDDIISYLEDKGYTITK